MSHQSYCLGTVDAPSCALLGGFAISAWVTLLWQHSTNAKCQRVLVLAVCLVLHISLYDCPRIVVLY